MKFPIAVFRDESQTRVWRCVRTVENLHEFLKRAILFLYPVPAFQPDKNSPRIKKICFMEQGFDFRE
jgi:hypothetical protein